MLDLIRALAIWVVTLLIAQLAVRDQPRQVRNLVVMSVAAHLAATLGMSWLVVTQFGGDMLRYERDGAELSTLMWRDSRMFGEVMNLFLQSEHMLPRRIIGAGTSTGSMVAMSAFVTMLVGTGTVVVASAFSAISYLTRLMLFQVARRWFAATRPDYVFIAIMLVPSVMVWSSGIFKEAVAVSGLALLIWGTDVLMARTRILAGLVANFFGFWFVFLFKSFLLVPFALALGLQIYASRAAARGGPKWSFGVGQLVFGAVLGVLGVIALSSLVPQLSIQQLSDQASNLQNLGQSVRGGSTYSLGVSIPSSPVGQLAYAPVAVFTSLYRPLIIEATNAIMVVNALETTLLLLASILLLRGRWSERVAMVVRSPALLFCLVFVFATALGVGLATTNLGTLSRYRMPLVPLFALILVVLHSRVAVRGPVRSTMRRRESSLPATPSPLQPSGASRSLAP
ncbi:MAG: hypothetical protein KGO50_07700 [Myxococcales bacterium]|nr:hypothetical protein [Myxococcales bacterium]